MRGRNRVETDQFVAVRSHYLFGSRFCPVGVQGEHEKGGVENGQGHSAGTGWCFGGFARAIGSSLR
ncbi:MAG: hypothetical protein J2P44_06155 [Candidatus Dormibacteraeota bacterium]|nr:hypothetical protein [Candidatus Dormibacteraeota bacterium]